MSFCCFVRSLTACAFLLFMFSIPGCKISESRPGIATVSGQVLNGDKPVAEAKILFLPAIKQPRSVSRFAFGKTNEQGRFTMRVSHDQYGAYVGPNLVIISTREDEKVEQEIKEDEAGKTPIREEGLKIIPAEEVKKKEKTDKTNETESESSVDEKPSIEEDKPNKLGISEQIANQITTQISVKPETIPSRFNVNSKFMFVVDAKGNPGTVFQVQSDQDQPLAGDGLETNDSSDKKQE